MELVWHGFQPVGKSVELLAIYISYKETNEHPRKEETWEFC